MKKKDVLCTNLERKRQTLHHTIEKGTIGSSPERNCKRQTAKTNPQDTTWVLAESPMKKVDLRISKIVTVAISLYFVMKLQLETKTQLLQRYVLFYYGQTPISHLGNTMPEEYLKNGPPCVDQK